MCLQAYIDKQLAGQQHYGMRKTVFQVVQTYMLTGSYHVLDLL